MVGGWERRLRNQINFSSELGTSDLRWAVLVLFGGSASRVRLASHRSSRRGQHSFSPSQTDAGVKDPALLRAVV